MLSGGFAIRLCCCFGSAARHAIRRAAELFVRGDVAPRQERGGAFFGGGGKEVGARQEAGKAERPEEGLENAGFRPFLRSKGAARRLKSA